MLDLINNGDGDRVSQTVDGVTTSYVIDIATPLTMVLAETTGTETIYYLHGLDLVAQSDGITTEYFGYDGLGSVRQMLGSSGSVLFAQVFDPYGNPYASAGTDSTSWGFAGEQTDAYIKLIYLRARWYSPQIGRFTTIDPWRGDYTRPLTLNPWLYVSGNPVNVVDPSGLISCRKSNDPDCQARAQILLGYAKAIKQSVIPGTLLPVEGFAMFTDFAMWLFDNDIRGMMWGTTNVLLGVDPNEHLFMWFAVPVPPEYTYGSNTGKYYVKQNWLPYRNDPSKDQGELSHSGRGDWHPQYWDGTANQAYHFWYYVATTFYDGDDWGWLANIVHDPYFLECLFGDDLEKLKDIPILNFASKLAAGASQEDYNLSLRGIELGVDLWWADFIYSAGNYDVTMFPGADPGNWIRTHLKE